MINKTINLVKQSLYVKLKLNFPRMGYTKPCRYLGKLKSLLFDQTVNFPSVESMNLQSFCSFRTWKVLRFAKIAEGAEVTYIFPIVHAKKNSSLGKFYRLHVIANVV